MYTIKVRNVSEALYVGLGTIKSMGAKIQSRAGETLEMPAPVCTTYTHPMERVLFYPQRDANPFFHCLEALWMLAGRNDVEFLKRYNKRMETYSDGNDILHGAYGHRWRNWFGIDQLDIAVKRLKKYPNDRRTVVQMWDSENDLYEGNQLKDIPCNTQIYFKVREGRLNMMVTCRSNDMIWGAYGANAVHFSMLQEYVAARVGVPVGTYHQVSDSFHAYTDVLKKLDGLVADYDPYHEFDYMVQPLVTDAAKFDDELRKFFDSPPLTRIYRNLFFSNVADRMRAAHALWRSGDIDEALSMAGAITAPDWRKACVEWLERRRKSDEQDIRK